MRVLGLAGWGDDGNCPVAISLTSRQGYKGGLVALTPWQDSSGL